MIIDQKKLFNNKVFTLSKDLQYKTIDTEIAKITIIENFYENIDSILDEIEKLPMTLVLSPERNENQNNLSFIDARKCFVTSIVGTEIPYIKNLKSLISEIINYPHEGILVDKKILINCFKFTELFKEKYKNYYYCIHTDDPIDYHSFGQIAIVLFLNKHYEIGEGINFYEHLFEPTESTFVSKDKVKVSHFVQAKCNTAVLFDSKIFHSQFTPTDQFTKEFRYTQVIFVPLFEV